MDGNPAIAAVKKGSTWDLVYLKGNTFMSTKTVYQAPGPRNEVKFTGLWMPPEPWYTDPEHPWPPTPE